MADSWKPKDYTSLSPYLTVPNARAEIEFLQKVFGATILREYHHPDGSIMHAELLIDDSVVMLGQATPTWVPTNCQMHLYVENVTAVYLRAIDAGGTSITEPQKQQGDPDRRGGILDPAGNTWWISTQEP